MWTFRHIHGLRVVTVQRGQIGRVRVGIFAIKYIEFRVGNVYTWDFNIVTKLRGIVTDAMSLTWSICG